MGHEYCGTVEEVGSAVATIKPGQFVIGWFFASDNACPHCTAGYRTCCQRKEFIGDAQTPLVRVPLADGAPSSGVSLFGIVQVLYYTCTEHPLRLLFGAMWRCARYTRPERSFPIALSDTLWFLFGLGATLSFREPIDPRGPTGGLKRFLRDRAATLCFAQCHFMIQGTGGGGR